MQKSFHLLQHEQVVTFAILQVNFHDKRGLKTITQQELHGMQNGTMALTSCCTTNKQISTSQKELQRPTNEGGNYVTFATIEDGLKKHKQIIMSQTCRK